MQIDVLFTSREATYTSLQGRTAVIIDVLRATTTIAAALSRGAVAVYPVADLEAARRRAQEGDGMILGGERGGLPPEGFHAGNSPLEYTAELVSDSTIVFTTTNGTLAISRALAAGASGLATGALVNAAAVSRWAVERGASLTLICAGTEERVTLEDAVGAGCIIAEVACIAPDVELTDAAVAARQLWPRYAGEPMRSFADSAHGRRLLELGFGADLRYCAAVNRLSVTPVWTGDRLVPERRA